jgi:hypothetical protein
MWFEKKVVLKLDENQKQFPIEVLNSWDITELEIIGGDFTYFPSDISILKNLKRLTLVSTKISVLPVELFELPELSYSRKKLFNEHRTFDSVHSGSSDARFKF